MSGTIPESLSHLTALTMLELSNYMMSQSSIQQLSGTIPQFNLMNMNMQLVNLRLSYTQKLSGTIPENLGDVTTLAMLQLDHTQLSGTIPDSLGHLRAPITLDLEQTHLSGTIPESLSHFTPHAYVDHVEIRLDSTNVTGCSDFCKAHPDILVEVGCP